MERTTYDEVLYPGYVLPQTHPDHLATLATLFGMQPAPATNCRVLELGCGDGGNLIPMAYGLPESQFVGVDLAAGPIEQGSAFAAEMGLKNVSLQQRDILKVGDDLGSFDYIIAHGVYSWVPQVVRDRILAICAESLTPNGVAYVSYNAMPGGHLRMMIREMMLFHVHRYQDPRQKIAQAVAFARFLVAAQTGVDTYQSYLREELEEFIKNQEWLMYHDDLADINQPYYLHQFVAQAAQHELVFLAEADFSEMQDTIYPPQITQVLQQLASNSVEVKEQILDFIKCRRFRQTLLCRKGMALDRSLRPDKFPPVRIASPAKPVSANPQVTNSAEEEFTGPRGAALKTDHALAKTVVYLLGKIWPQSMSFDELLHAARRHVDPNAKPDDPDVSQDARVLGEVIAGISSAGLAELSMHKFEFASHPGERPIASPLARLQIEHGLDRIASLRHTPVLMDDELSQRLLLLLDGTRGRAALKQELVSLLQSGEVNPPADDEPVADPAVYIEEKLEPALERLASHSLLLA